MLSQEKYADIAHHQLSAKQYEVLNDIRTFLRIPHQAQQVLSAEKTPTLCFALPLYERMIEVFKNVERGRPKIAHAVRSARQYLENYLALSRKTRAYSLAISTSQSAPRFLHTISCSSYISDQSHVQA
jgi:hypothetical protein